MTDLELHLNACCSLRPDWVDETTWRRRVLERATPRLRDSRVPMAEAVMQAHYTEIAQEINKLCDGKKNPQAIPQMIWLLFWLGIAAYVFASPALFVCGLIVLVITPAIQV